MLKEFWAFRLLARYCTTEGNSHAQVPTRVLTIRTGSSGSAMALIRYDIVPTAEGWSVTCNDVPGRPYHIQADAVRDTLFVAQELSSKGDKVEVRLLELDGPRRVWTKLEVRDAHLFREAP